MIDKFKVGDLIRVTAAADTWLDQGSELSQIFTVLEDNGNPTHTFCPDTNTCDLVTVNDWSDDFVLVMRAPVFSLDYTPATPIVDEREVIMSLERDKVEGASSVARFGSTHLGAVYGPVQVPTPELGVYRPNLEDRKVGKVRVELVDHGFPLALREVAKVMSWAQTAKGYKDHDWQNLPNPEQGLGGATSRHCTDNIIQRMVDGKPAIECTDHESKILHKAHEAFGVLAQLELILRGVIK